MQAVDQNAVLALLACDILHIDVSHRRNKSAFCGLVGLIFQVDAHHGFAALSYAHVPHIYILSHAAAAGVGLQAKYTVEIGRVHLAVFHEHVAATARNLGTDHHATVSVGHRAMAHDDVLRRNVPKASVLVASALDSDAVVARLEAAVLNEHVLARLWVASVAVGAVVDDGQAAHGDILRQQGMHHPEGRAQQGDAFEQNVFTLIKVDELWAQAFSLELALLDGGAGFGILEQQRAAHLLAFDGLGSPAVGVLATHRPPRLVGAVAIDGAAAGDGDVLLAVGIDAGLIVHEVHALPARLHNGEELRIEGKEQMGALFKIEVDIALQGDGTCGPGAGRHYHASAASLRTGCNGFVDGLLVLVGLGV